MTWVHTDTVLNKLNKVDLVQLTLNAATNLGSQIAKFDTEVKDLLVHSR